MSIEVTIENIEHTLINVLASKDLVTNDKLILSMITQYYIENKITFKPTINDYVRIKIRNESIDSSVRDKLNEIDYFLIDADVLKTAYNYAINGDKIPAIKHIRKQLLTKVKKQHMVDNEIAKLKSQLLDYNDKEFIEDRLFIIEKHKDDLIIPEYGLKLCKCFIESITEHVDKTILNIENGGQLNI